LKKKVVTKERGEEIDEETEQWKKNQLNNNKWKGGIKIVIKCKTKRT